jgi:diacylglycerol O-acyltransferase-1
MTEAALSTSLEVPALEKKLSGRAEDKSPSPPRHTSVEAPKPKKRGKYRHIAAYHSKLRTSCLSRDSTVNPSFIGFRNLMVIVLSEPRPPQMEQTGATLTSLQCQL